MWKERYKIGVPLIDAQHEELFNRVSDFVKSLRAEGNWEDKLPMIRNTMEFMQEYVIVHFEEEEAYQRKIHYPYYEDHRRIHNDFREEVYSFVQEFKKDESNEKLIQAFAGKLLAWLINHVAAMDQKIAEYALSKGGTVE